MSKKRLTPTGRTALWVGSGGFGGLAVGAAITNPTAASGLAPMWGFLFALYVGGILLFARAPRADEDARPAPAAAPRKASREPAAPSAAVPAADVGNLAMRFEFPDVPADFPPVFGIGDKITARVVVTEDGEAAQGAAVRLRAEGDGPTQRLEGITGSDGSIVFAVPAERVGDLALRAEASHAKRGGVEEAHVSVVRYEDEIQRLFGEFRTYAIGVLGPESAADTARELAERLRPSAGDDAAKALLELARIYELVAYGEREADRRLYLAVMRQLLVLDEADLPDSPDVAPPTKEA